MTLLVAKKEILENLLSLKFVIAFLLCLSLVVVSTFTNLNYYLHLLDQYQTRNKIQEDFYNNYAHFNRLEPISRVEAPPPKLTPFIRGIGEETEIVSLYENPFGIFFQPIDFLFIISLILSLLAIIFSYNAISGERERGTIKLLCANSISKDKVLIGKSVGGNISIFLPFTISYLVGVLMVFINSKISLSNLDRWAILLIFVISCFYISCFYNLALFISSIFRRSSISMLTSLFAWVVIVLIIPNASPYIASQIYPIPSVALVEKQIKNLDLERQQAIRMEFETRVGSETEAEFLKSEKFDEINEYYKKKIEKIREDFNRRASKQFEISRVISYLSPYACFIYLTTDISGTGLRRQEHVRNLKKIFYNERFYPYVKTKWEQLVAKNPSFSIEDKMDLRDRPRFLYEEEDLKDRINASLVNIGFLIFYNLLFILLGYFSFIRSDL